MKLVTMMAKACCFAQEHIDDPEAWSMKKKHREVLLQCVSYQMACFFAQETQYGHEGVCWDVVIEHLIRKKKSVQKWEKILNRIAMTLGGWRK